MRDKLTAAGAEAGCPGVFCFWKAKAGYTFNYRERVVMGGEVVKVLILLY